LAYFTQLGVLGFFGAESLSCAKAALKSAHFSINLTIPFATAASKGAKLTQFSK